MAQFVLMESYCGMSGFVYEVTSTGRTLTMGEALERGLVNDKQLKRNRDNDYRPDWHEILPGDQIIVEMCDDNTPEEELNEDYVKRMVFIVPETGLPDPPMSLDDKRHFITGRWFHEYLAKHCQCITNNASSSDA